MARNPSTPTGMRPTTGRTPLQVDLRKVRFASKLPPGWGPTLVAGPSRSLSLKLRDTRVYEPQTRTRLGTTAHLCKVVVLKLRAQVDMTQHVGLRCVGQSKPERGKEPLPSDNLKRLKDFDLKAKSLTVLYVPYSLDSGRVPRRKMSMPKRAPPSLFGLTKFLPPGSFSGDTTPCRMTGVTLHSHVHYNEI